MQRRARAGGGEGRRRRAPRADGSRPALEDLQRRFAEFRGHRRRGVRIPEELRARALAALQQGVTFGQLQRSCGVGWTQVLAWQGSRQAAPGVRAFTVVEPTESLPPLPPSPVVGEDLELRVGSWSVTVRLAEREPSPAGTGNACCR